MILYHFKTGGKELEGGGEMEEGRKEGREGKREVAKEGKR